MQSKVSWFKRGIFAQDLRNVGWIGIIYQIALLFAVPLQIFMMHQANRLPYNYLQVENHNLFTVLTEFQILLMFTVPVILSVILFRYLQVKVPADFIHSMPVKRTVLFYHHTVMGIFLLIIPVIVTAIILAIVHSTLALDSYFSVTEIVKWAGMTILMNVFVFVMTTLIGTVTGISAVQVVLTYIFLIFPAGIMILLYSNIKYFIYGFAFDYYFDQNLEFLTPIVRMAEMYRWKITTTEVLVYLALTAGFYLLAMLAYKKRNIEGATQAIAFRYLKPVFKYGATICTMLLGGAYFGETQQESLGWLVFGYFFGSILGYVIAEMVLQKTWRIFRNMKGYIIYAVAVAAIGFLLNLDITGYEQKLPTANEIEHAYFGDSVYLLKESESDDYGEAAVYGDYKAYPTKALNKVDRFYFKDKGNISLILKLHEQVIENRNNRFHNPLTYQNIVIAYELKNGATIVRQYQVPNEAYDKFLKPIYETKEYRYSNNDLLRLKEDITIDKITTSSYSAIPKKYETVNPQQIAEIINVLKTDMLQEPYEEMATEREVWGEIELLLNNNKRLNIPWKKSYHQFDEWLKGNNLLEQARVVPADIAYILVARNKDYVDAPVGMAVDYVDLFQGNTDTIKIEDPDEIEACLTATSWRMEEEYVAAIYYKNAKEPEYRGLETAPSFIADHFKN